MTEQELHTLRVHVYNVTDGVHEYSVRFYSEYNGSPIEFTFTNIKTGVENNITFVLGSLGKYILQNPMKMNWLGMLSIKKKPTHQEFTIDELKQLETGSVIYYEGIKFTLAVEKSSIAPTTYYMHNTDSMGNNIQFCLKWPYVKVEFGFNGLVPGNSSICISKFLSDVKIMHKVLKTTIKENKMKTEFKQEQPKNDNTYPMFMKPKIDSGEDGYVVLFFKESHGVVVSTTGKYFVNYFSTTWIMDRLTPVEGCSVTFSDKD